MLELRFHEKALKAGIRLIYRIDDIEQRLDVIAVGKRKRLHVFMAAARRLDETP